MISPPMCRQCGLPLAAATGVSGLPEFDLTCGRCLVDPPAFARARSVFAYDEVARQLVGDLKYRDRLEGRASFGIWLARAAAELAAQAGLIVPVPLHYARLVRRRYNQAAILAQALAERTGRPLGVDALVRQRLTKSQTGLTLEERARNMRGAFAVRSKWQPAVKDAQILLVDDVMTTGATANACAKALLRAGAHEVTVVTLARTKEPV
jgi:ComF family protein